MPTPSPTPILADPGIAGAGRFRDRTWPVGLALAAVTFVVFSPSLRNGFVWDDVNNLVNNPEFRGLGWTQLRWMFTSVHLGHYIPLTWITFGLDYLVWGMNPVGYHLTNLLLHSANVVLFWLVAERLLRKGTALGNADLRVAAVTAALLFAVHPLRAESVAWTTERRDVLSGFFFLLTVKTYLEACDAEAKRRRRLLAISVGTYLAALASKSIVMTLPAVLILLDVYPLGRLRGNWREWFGPSVRGVWLEKLPYLISSLCAVVMAYHAQIIVTALGTYPWGTRVTEAFFGLWLYVLKTLLPVGLSPLYEVPVPLNPFEPRFLGSFVGVLGLTVAMVLLRGRWPAGLAVWTFYGIMLAPVSGIPVRTGFQLAADRYSYLACLGWALLVGAGAGALVRARAHGDLRPWLARAAAGAAVLWFVVMGALTWRQVQIWRDTGTLWWYAVSVTPECAVCHTNLGLWLIRQGDPLAGLQHLQWAAALRPDRVFMHATNLGLAFTKLGRLPDAVEQYERALAASPDAGPVRLSLASVLWQLGRREEAVSQLEQGLRWDSDDAVLHANLGMALLGLGRVEEAVEHLRRAVTLRPSTEFARVELIRAYMALGKTELAREQEEALESLRGGPASRPEPSVLLPR